MNKWKWMFWTAVLAVIVVAVVAGVVSYDYLYTVAIAAGEDDWIARLIPLSADGLLISASLSAFVAKWQNRKVHAMTKLSLSVGLTASVAANIASPFVGGLTGTPQDILAAIVGAWPAVALALSFEEVLRLSALWKAEATTEDVMPEAKEVDSLPEPVAIVEVPEAIETVEVITEEVPEAPQAEVAPLPEVATPPVRKSVIATAPKPGNSVKAEALAYMARRPETTATELADRFNRSDRWARGIRSEFQKSGKTLQLVTA